ncbi:hypothetical protein T07_6410, partial [Trichinella nelsoni]
LATHEEGGGRVVSGLPHECRAKRTDTEIQGAPTDARNVMCVPNTGHGLFWPLGSDSYPKVTVTFWSFAITSQNGLRRIQRAPKRPRKLPTYWLAASFRDSALPFACTPTKGGALNPPGQWARGTHQSNAVEYAGQTLPRVQGPLMGPAVASGDSGLQQCCT